MRLPEEQAPICMVMTGVFNQNGRVNNAILKGENFSFDGDLDENQHPVGSKVRLEWRYKLFACIFVGNVESNIMKQGKLDIKLGDKVVQSIEGIFDVPLMIEKVG